MVSDTEFQQPADAGSSAGFAWLRRFVPNSLAVRLALTYAGLSIAIVALLGWSLIATIQQFSVDRLQQDLMEETQLASDMLAPLLAADASDADIAAVASRFGSVLGARVTVVRGDGTVLADSEHDVATMDNHAGRPEIQAALRTGVGTALRPSSTMEAPYFYVARSIAGGEGVVRMGMPVQAVQGLLRDVRQQVAGAALFAGVLMAGAGWFVASRIGAGLRDMREQARAVAAGQLDAMVNPAPTQELGDLGRAFNTMTITLRNTLEELERVRARLEATLADLSDGVVITDSRGHIVLANEAALTMLAVRRPVIGEPFMEVGRDHELAELVTSALLSRDDSGERLVQHGRSGRTLQAAARRLDVAHDRIGVIVLRDVTELRRLETVRRDFVANVSHELRTPLTSIRAMVETLEAGALHDPEVSSDFLQRIISEVDRLAAMVDELLDLARLESGRLRVNLEDIDPAEMARHAVHRLAPQIERAGLLVRLASAENLPRLRSDREKIDQVLLNLIHNAIKYTPSGGAITVRTTHAGAWVEFQVIDTGVGLDPEEIPRLFERFYKADRARRSQGTGLGLAIAKHIVQAHGGRIWADLNSPTGAIFTFQLPIAGPDVQIADGEATGHNASRLPVAPDEAWSGTGFVEERDPSLRSVL